MHENEQMRHHPEHPVHHGQAPGYPVPMRQEPVHDQVPAPVEQAYFPPMKTPADEVPAETGYADRVITVPFPNLTRDPVNDPVWVQMRNPMLVPPEMLMTDVPTGPDGMPISQAAALASMYEVIGKLALDWRAYDSKQDPREKPMLLGAPSAETAARLPIAIINAIGKMIEAAATPQ